MSDSRKNIPENDESEYEDDIDIDEFQRSLSSIEQSPNTAKPSKTAHMSIIDNFEEIKQISENSNQPPPNPSKKPLILLTLTTTLFTLSLLYIIKRKKLF